MAGINYKGYIIQLQSFEDRNHWRPKALVLGDTGMKPPPRDLGAVSSTELCDTEMEANARATQLARDWIDRRIQGRGGRRQPVSG